MNEHVGLRNQGAQTFNILVDIEGHAALIGIQIQKEATLLRVGLPLRKRASGSRQVTARFLDFDHIGAKVCQQLCGIRRRHHIAEFQYANALQALHNGPPSHVP